MRIIHLIYDDIKNPWCGGGGAVRAYEVNHRLARKHDITMITGNYPDARDRLVDGIRYMRVGISKNYLLSRITFSLLALVKLRNLRCDVLIDDFSSFSPCFAPLYCRSPVVTLIQSYLGYHSFRKYPVAGILSFFFEYLNVKIADFVITVSPWMERKIKSKVKRDTLVKRIFNGLDNEWFDIHDFEEDNYILFVGRIDFYTKGIDILLKAFALVSQKIPEIVLKVVGKGKQKDTKKTLELMSKLGIGKRVELVGPIYEFDKKSRLFTKSKFICMPSRFESWGIVAIEAGAAGKAVVGTRIPGLSDSVIDGETGMLVPPDSPDELAKAMIYLLENKKERKRLGENGRKRAKGFNWDNVAKEQEQFYREVLHIS